MWKCECGRNNSGHRYLCHNINCAKRINEKSKYYNLKTNIIETSNQVDKGGWGTTDGWE